MSQIFFAILVLLSKHPGRIEETLVPETLSDNFFGSLCHSDGTGVGPGVVGGCCGRIHLSLTHNREQGGGGERIVLRNAILFYPHSHVDGTTGSV
jgi:hypothetical protein